MEIDFFWRDETPHEESKDMVMMPFPRVPECLKGMVYADDPWWGPVGPGSIHPMATVEEWQRRLLMWVRMCVDVNLKDLGVLKGTFSPLTVEWTKRFQREYGLEPTGTVTPETDDKMLEILQP